MERDERIQEMTDDLVKGLLAFICKQKSILTEKYGMKYGTPDKQYKSAFSLALRKALREVEPKKKRKFIHLFCGAVFDTKEEATIHSSKGGCKPSKQTQKALAAQDRVLKRRRKKAL